MSQGILLVLLWWFCISVMGLITWPLSRRFFRSFHDEGYILSKGLGLILTGFINWILCSLHIIPFSVVSIGLSIVIVAVASWFLKSGPISEFVTFLKNQSKFVLTIEGVFLLAFLGFAFVRMANPDIAQTEKMPDFAFLTGIVNSDYFAPRDPWFAGGTINYFYYGHYMIALLTKLTGVPTEYGYNLGVSVVFALTLLAAIGISYNLIKKIGYGILGGLFVAFIGNLDCSVQLLSGLSEILSGAKKFYPFSWYNWWMSSRVIVREGIDVTINEFPFWSYILGDLHAHMNVVPLSLIVLAVILELFRSSGNGSAIVGKSKDFWFRFSIVAIALGTIPCANTWDVPTYFALIVVAMLIGRQFALKSGGLVNGFAPDEEVSMLQIVVSPMTDIKNRVLGKIDSEWVKLFISWGCIALIIVGAIVLYFPFHHSFHPAGTEGVRFLNPEQRTLVDDFLTIYGFFFYCLAPFAVALVYPRFKNLNERIRPLTAIAVIVMFFVLLIAFNRFMVAFCSMCLLMVLVIPFKRNDPELKNKFFALALFVTALVILLGCEFVYIKDAYGHPLERQNTVFKFYYQAWILCGISAGYAVYWMREKASKALSLAWEPGFRILLIAVVMFPIVASAAKTGYFRSFTQPSQTSKATLDGMFYLTWQYPGDYKAIYWLRRNASPDERILEASGPAFSHYGRISAGTGMSTILGWANHENIWRDGTWKTVGERKKEVKTVYTSNNKVRMCEVLDKYKIHYVYYGKLEREQYPESSPSNFAFMEKVMEVRDSDQKMTYLYRYNSSAVL